VLFGNGGHGKMILRGDRLILPAFRAAFNRIAPRHSALPDEDRVAAWVDSAAIVSILASTITTDRE
jgi:hypothetical protein